MIEMYLAGISARSIEDVTQELCGDMSQSINVNNLNKKVYGRIDKWPIEPIADDYLYAFLDDICLKRSWDGEVCSGSSGTG